MNKPTAGGDKDAAHGGGRRLPIYRLAWSNVTRAFSSAIRNIAGGGHATAPGPLEVIAAQPACDIHRLTHDVQSLNPFGHHGF